MHVLSINCGSSSLKYAVFECRNGDEHVVERGSVDRIGQAGTDHSDAVHQAVDALESRGVTIDAVGHRVVHGGADRSAPAIVDSGLLLALDALAPFAPLHLPAEIRVMRALAERWPHRLQVACFDTAFHRTLSEVASRYALPEPLHASGVRRYGFHGLSYEYVVASLGAKALGRAVLAHLGGGSSLAAVRDGHSVDTTMGFTPAGGLVMGTRPGDMDPSLVVYLLGRGYDARSLGELLNTQCGLQGLSGSTSDVRELLARRKGDPRAKMALDVYVFSARKWVGAMAAVLGGIDTLVFTGGIGEHAPSIRAEIACGLEHLGVHVDAARNDQNAAIISPDGTSCSVYVVRTDEERMVARHTRALVASAQAARGRATEFP